MGDTGWRWYIDAYLGNAHSALIVDEGEIGVMVARTVCFTS